MFSWGTKLQISLKIGCYRCLKTSKLEGFDRESSPGPFKQCSHVQMFFLAFSWKESLGIALTFYGINFKITNLDLF